MHTICRFYDIYTGRQIPFAILTGLYVSPANTVDRIYRRSSSRTIVNTQSAIDNCNVQQVGIRDNIYTTVTFFHTYILYDQVTDMRLAAHVNTYTIFTARFFLK